MIKPDISEKRQALSKFNDLLNSDTKEKDWQLFFDENPFILTETLPLKFDCLFRQVPLISGIPDYVFYRKTGTSVTGDYGIIELKCPKQSIIGSYSSKIIIPSTHVRTAQQQATLYLESLRRGEFINSEDFFVAGNRRYAFILIGNSEEVTRKCKSEILLHQFRSLLPQGFLLFTYDEVFKSFSSSMPPVVQVLFTSPIETKIRELVCSFIISWRLGIHARPAVRIVNILNRFHSEIKFEKEGNIINAMSILSLLTLAVVEGDRIVVHIKGYDAEAALTAIAELILSDFYME